VYSVLSAQGIYVSMYRSMFSIEGNDCEREVMIGEVTVVILYNLAVLHQELGLSMANNNASFFVRMSSFPTKWITELLQRRNFVGSIHESSQ
jgi:hypothetical protein